MWVGSWVVGVDKCLGYKKKFFQQKNLNQNINWKKSFKIHETKISAYIPRVLNSPSPRSAKQISESSSANGH